jgi:hypothetical protein
MMRKEGREGGDLGCWMVSESEPHASDEVVVEVVRMA